MSGPPLRQGNSRFCELLLEFRLSSDKETPFKPPSLALIFLGCIPFLAVCFSVSLWDRVYPIVLGLPFNFFWLTLWLLLTPLCMWGAYRMEAPRARDTSREGDGAD